MNFRTTIEVIFPFIGEPSRTKNGKLRGTLMDDIVKQIEGISDKETFLYFIQKFIVDYRDNFQECENKSLDEYLEAMMSWIEDFSISEFNNIDWSNINYPTIAKYYTWERFMNS